MFLVKQADGNSPGHQHYDTPLLRFIFQSLSKKREVFYRFDEFMELSLYHPDHGYYAVSENNQIGREGDFFTSVSVGKTYGWLLSFALENRWAELCPDRDCSLVIVEQGAHDGQLARDILDSLVERSSPLLEGISYRIIDERGTLASATELEPYRDRIEVVDGFVKAKTKRGIFLCNELLDAFPVRRFAWQGKDWKEWYVRADPEEEQLSLVTRPIADRAGDEVFRRFEELVSPFQDTFEEGYSTEFCPQLGKWMEDCSTLFETAGSWWIVDYGYEAADYFDPLRKTGTLRCFDRHRAHEDPLWKPGENDLTAHVNFTDLRNAGTAAGLEVCSLVDQSAFLTRAASDWLVSMDGKLPDSENARRLRQFQTLTHPSLMGQRFRMLEFVKKRTSEGT